MREIKKEVYLKHIRPWSLNAKIVHHIWMFERQQRKDILHKIQRTKRSSNTKYAFDIWCLGNSETIAWICVKFVIQSLKQPSGWGYHNSANKETEALGC